MFFPWIWFLGTVLGETGLLFSNVHFLIDRKTIRGYTHIKGATTATAGADWITNKVNRLISLYTPSIHDSTHSHRSTKWTSSTPPSSLTSPFLFKTKTWSNEKDRRILFFFFKKKRTKFDPFWHDIVWKSTKERKGNITAWMMENNHEERWQSHQRFHQQINKEISSLLFVAVSCSRVIIIANHYWLSLRSRGFVRWTPHFYAVDDDVIQTFDQSQIKPPTRKRCQQMAFSNFFPPHRQ